ncbi:MAG: SAM-dependent methyltransferase, partial [Alsobacter sp.]
MTPLGREIARLVAAEGPISVERYMALCLGHPVHGYYMTRDPFGAGGDFVTAPEVSQMFGELVGLWCVDTWQRMGAPAPFRLVELGPGRGTLMADALRAARLVPAFLDAAQVHLVETSPVLRARQAA